MQHFLVGLCMLCCLFVSAQKETYWQQEVNYKIDVSLNDTTHVLTGFISMGYINHSPDTLKEILIHLWPNAYRDHTTPLAKQMLENGKKTFHFSKPNQRGFIDKIDFKLNAEVCRWNFAPNTKEIARVKLNVPLAPGETVTIATPFRVKLPNTFSRLGHIDQSYQITQWYPKPAVYDRKGWHVMPYLDQGEFYSEYGSFDVSITLPKNYVVGATGDLQTPEEQAWIDSIADATKKLKAYGTDIKFPASSPTQKTVRFTQQNIHDFAWFADKRYHILKDTVTLPNSGKVVTTYSLFTNNQADIWNKAPGYLHDAIYHYSKYLGDYPYNQVTALDGTISAGGGMEYPNITIIGEEKDDIGLDVVITHEVGHNWFYGLLGSNEREHGWMDEGLNSYYENRYVKAKYPNQKIFNGLPVFVQKFLDINQYHSTYLNDFGYQVLGRENEDQALNLHSSDFTDMNYGATVYGKTSLLFNYLEAYLGTALLDTCMKTYYEKFKYKHPQPEDLRAVLEETSGKKLNWLFDELINTNKKIDYSIKRVFKKRNTPSIILKNKAEISSPVMIAYMKRDSVLSTEWITGFEGKKTILAKIPEGADKVKIDPWLAMPEVNRRNNTYKLSKPFPKIENLKFQFLGAAENQDRTQVFFAPYLGWNNYDKTQVGLMLYSPFLPSRKFNYFLAPAIGTGSRQFIGMGNVNYTFFPDQTVQRFTVGVSGKRFSYLLFPQNLTINKIEPFAHIVFKKKNARSPFSHEIKIRSALLWLGRLDNHDQPFYENYYINELNYLFKRESTLHPFQVNATVRQGDNFLALQAEGKFNISYKKRNEGLEIRLFAGGFPIYTKNNTDISSPLPRMFLSTATVNSFAYWLQRDYMFDETFIDRNGRDKYLGRQVATTGGAFRSFTTFGATNKFLVSTNIRSSIHRFVPILPFVSAAAIVTDLNKTEFAMELGLTLALIKNVAEIHLPLVTTNNIKRNQEVLGISKWYQRITFTLQLNMQRPLDFVKTLF